MTKPVAFTAEFALEDAPGGTKVTMTAAPASGVTRLIWPLFARMGGKQYAVDFAKLKRVLEERG